MPRIKKTQPDPSREKGQRSLEPVDNAVWFLRPQWLRPDWYNAELWRKFVLLQPVAMNCKDTLIASLSSLDWKIEPRDSTQRDELKEEIKYYERFFQNGSDFDFVELIEWLGQDYLDLPFGSGMEVGRTGDDPAGRVEWLIPLDGGTLFPTLNGDFPVGQAIPTNLVDKVYFPWYAINRMYMSPRTNMERKGWGMAPPEKIFLAIEMINRGDKYYAQLLLDTPEAGILDLGNMEKDAALEWIKSFQALMTGIDPFKVPVLYEHETDTKYIPFGRPPTELLFDRVTTKYASLVAAGYNMSLSDIGFGTSSSGGETLAGSIRQERKTRRTGFARAKLKMKYWFDRLLPLDLEYKWIDPDDELAVALGRARLATSTADGILVDKRLFSPKELRMQMVADGLITIPVPEDVDQKEFDVLPQPAPSPFGNNGTAKKPGMLGTQVPPSQGGQGEVKSKAQQEMDLGIERIIESLGTRSPDFTFLPDADGIAEEFAGLIEPERSEEIKHAISEYVKSTAPQKFMETYSKALPYLDLEDDNLIAEKVGEELNNLRYNYLDDLSNNVINIVKGNNHGTTKKNNGRRRSSKHE